jgi:hypothetical protein
MADSAGPHRTSAPAHQAFDTSLGEQSVLRGITPENMGGMYGLLLNQRAGGAAAQDAYGQLLDAVNRQQAGISAQRTAFDNRELEHKTIGNLVQHGGMSTGVALSGLGLTGGNGALAPILNRQQTAEGVLRADDIRQRVDEATALQRAGAGTWDAANAGVQVTPGQTLAPGARGLIEAQRTVTTPIPITTAGIAAAGHASGEKAPKVMTYWDAAAQEWRTQVTASTPEASFSAAERVQQLAQAARDRDIAARRGNFQQGGTVGGPTGTPPPRAPAVTSPGSVTNPPRATGPAAGAQPATTPATGTTQRRPPPPVGAPLTQRERDIMSGAEARFGRMTGYTRTGDGRLIVNAPRGTYHIPAE